MVTNTTNFVRRSSTSLISLALAGIGTIAVGSAFPLASAVAQLNDRVGAAATVGNTTNNSRIPVAEYAQRDTEVQVVQSAPAPGNVTPKSFKDCGFCPEMVAVPGGSFLMGSPATENGHTVDETPQQQVNIERPFAVGKYEVTIAEWQICVNDAACAGDHSTSPGNDRRPMTGISWDDAQAYVAWLSRRTGKKYRLLTEAEWEYAARAGTTTPYHTGLTISADQANIADKRKKPAGKGRRTGFGMKVTVKRTGPVGSFPPNGFGLHDVHGNVWEWVADCVNDGYVGAPTDGSAWTSGKCHRRIIRGGSWVDYAVGARSAIRSGLGTGDRGRTLGLRVARTLN